MTLPPAKAFSAPITNDTLNSHLSRLSLQTANIWQNAAETLTDDERKYLNVSQDDKLNLLETLHCAARKRKQECFEKRWTIRKPNGERLILRDLCEKIIIWVEKFQRVGDCVMQFDPTHAALPWAAVRFIMQVALNDSESYGAFLEGVERSSCLITRCTILEAVLYKSSISTASDNASNEGLKHTLTKLYASILQFLSQTVRYFKRNTAKRIVKSVFEPAWKITQNFIEAIAEADREVSLYMQQIGQQSLQQISVQNKRLEQLITSLDEPINRLAAEIIVDRMKMLQRQKLLGWLSEIQYKDHHRLFQNERLAGTGDWLLGESVFMEWRKSSSSSVLWLHGIPGSGKTCLVSHVIDTLSANNSELFAYFYCSSNISEPERSDPAEILRCILRQLCSSTADQPIRDPVAQTFVTRDKDSQKDGFELAKLSVEECTVQIIGTLEESPGTLVIDAIDECDPRKRHQLLATLDRIIQESSSLVKIFVSSRDDDDTVQRLEKSSNIYVSACDNSADIIRFIQSEVDRAIVDGRLLGGRVSTGLKNRILECLIAKAQGMFRWVSLQLQYLCDSRRFKLQGDVLSQLGKLPTSLKDSYDLIYQQVLDSGPQSKIVAELAIGWLLCGLWRLESEALIAAMASSETGSISSEGLSQKDILNICCNLLVFDDQTQVFRFAHHSAQEYLSTRPEYSKRQLQKLAAKACLNVYLDQKPQPRSWETYAARFLPVHLKHAAIFQDHALERKSDEFIGLQSKKPHAFAEWGKSTLQNVRDPHDYVKGLGWQCYCPFEFETQHPLCMLASFGITPLVKKLLHTARSSLTSEQRQMCLVKAGEKGHTSVLEHLLSHGFKLDLKSYIAILRGMQRKPDLVMKILFDDLARSRMRINSEALRAAASNRYHSLEITELLLVRVPGLRVTVDALMAAVQNEMNAEEVTKLLLAHSPGTKIHPDILTEAVSQKGCTEKLLHILFVHDPTINVSANALAVALSRLPIHRNYRFNREEWLDAGIAKYLLKKSVGISIEEHEKEKEEGGEERDEKEEEEEETQGGAEKNEYGDEDTIVEAHVKEDTYDLGRHILLKIANVRGELSGRIFEAILAQCDPVVLRTLFTRHPEMQVTDSLLRTVARDNWAWGPSIFSMLMGVRDSHQPIPGDLVETTIRMSTDLSNILPFLFFCGYVSKESPILAVGLRRAVWNNDEAAVQILWEIGIRADEFGRPALDLALELSGFGHDRSRIIDILQDSAQPELETVVKAVGEREFQEE